MFLYKIVANKKGKLYSKTRFMFPILLQACLLVIGNALDYKRNIAKLTGKTTEQESRVILHSVQQVFFRCVFEIREANVFNTCTRVREGRTD